MLFAKWLLAVVSVASVAVFCYAAAHEGYTLRPLIPLGSLLLCEIALIAVVCAPEEADHADDGVALADLSPSSEGATPAGG